MRHLPWLRSTAALLLAGALVVAGVAGSGVVSPPASGGLSDARLADVAPGSRVSTAAEEAAALRGAVLGADRVRTEAARQASARAVLAAQAARRQAAAAATASRAAAAAPHARAHTTPPQPKRAPVRRAVVHTAPAVETPQQRGTRLLAALNYPWQKLGYRIEFLPARPGYLGMTYSERKLIQIYVKGSDLVLSHSIAHEIGHALDFSRNTPAQRRSYLAIRGLPVTSPWYGCSGCTDYATPAGDWAEVFAYWLAGPGDFRSRMAGPPSDAQLTALAPMFGI